MANNTHPNRQLLVPHCVFGGYAVVPEFCLPTPRELERKFETRAQAQTECDRRNAEEGRG